MKQTQIKWTLVQHSAAGFKSDPVFENAVEERMLYNKKQIDAVRRRGGFLFDSYKTAYDRAESENYPAYRKDSSLVPTCRGTFSRYKVEGLKLYIPKAE